jgi:hypothetical protein
MVSIPVEGFKISFPFIKYLRHDPARIWRLHIFFLLFAFNFNPTIAGLNRSYRLTQKYGLLNS